MNQPANIIHIGDRPESEPRFNKASFSNLKRHKTGVYHAHAKVLGTLIRRSLKTKSIQIAKIKLDELLKSERARLSKRPEGEWTFFELASKFNERLAGKKESTQKYRRETLQTIRNTWANVDNLPPKAFTEPAVLEWSKRIWADYSPSRYNGIIQTMRSVLQGAVDLGLIAENPAVTRKRNSDRGIPFAEVPITEPSLPDAKEFKAMLAKLDSVPHRKRGAQFIRLLAYGGMRISSARKLMPEHIDLKNNQILLPAVKFEKRPVGLPMIPDLRKLITELLANHPGGSAPLLPIKSPRKALEKACAEAKIPILSPHKLRHLFATRCLESGVDVKTVAAWLGHKDGGALLLKRYAHLRDEHSQNMAKRVKF